MERKLGQSFGVKPLTTNVTHHIETSQLIDWFLYDGDHWLMS